MLRARGTAPIILTVVLLNVGGWITYALLIEQLGGASALAGLGVVAFSLGVRHAFDADHIAAIDDSSRLLVGRGERPYSLGLFFALGHSSVVFVLCIGAGLAGGLLAAPQMQSLQDAGSRFAALAAAAFLLLVGLMNLRIFLRPESVAPSGIMHSLFGDSFRKRLTATWQMFPIGFVFGLGLGTASEVALLGMSASVASSGSVPLLAMLTLPVLFAAGMTLCDTADSIAMVNVYARSASPASGRRSLNRIMTGMTAAVALFVGFVYLAQVLEAEFGVHSLSAVAQVADHFEAMGYAIVAAYSTVWLIALGASRRQSQTVEPSLA